MSNVRLCSLFISSFSLCSCVSLCLRRRGSRPTMASSSLSSFLQISSSPNFTVSNNPFNPHHKFLIAIPTRKTIHRSCFLSSSSTRGFLQKSLPLAASIAILISSSPGTPSLFLLALYIFYSICLLIIHRLILWCKLLFMGIALINQFSIFIELSLLGEINYWLLWWDSCTSCSCFSIFIELYFYLDGEIAVLVVAVLSPWRDLLLITVLLIKH